MRRLIAIVITAMALSLPFAAPVLAEERTCRGSIGATTVDNLRVPQGATCTLTGTRVEGTIKIEANAVLKASDVRVIGNIQAEDSRRVVVKAGSRVGGSIQVVQSVIAKVKDSRVNGNIQLDDNSGLNVVRRNVVGEDVQAFKNTGGVRIFDNRIAGNLQCKENHPRPVGDRNMVEGNKEDQCRGF